jgi:hypothetical protein
MFVLVIVLYHIFPYYLLIIQIYFSFFLFLYPFWFTLNFLQPNFLSIFFIVATTLPYDSYLWFIVSYPDSCPCKSAIFTHQTAIIFFPTPLFNISPDTALSTIPPYFVSYKLLRVTWLTWGNSATFTWIVANNIWKVKFILVFRMKIILLANLFHVSYSVRSNICNI